MKKYIVVIVSAGSKEEAEKITYALVEKKLVACGKVLGPAKSFYTWQGKIESKEEWVILVKSTKKAFNEIKNTIKTMHSYDVPEILSLPVDEGNEEYFSWISGSVLLKYK